MLSQYFGIAYFEVRIAWRTVWVSVFFNNLGWGQFAVPEFTEISIGLSTRDFPLTHEWLPTYGQTYGYEMSSYGVTFAEKFGTFWGHNVEGSVPKWGNRWIAAENSSFYTGDVVGCGVILATRQIIYTLNGRRLNTSGLFVSTTDLYPTVSLEWNASVVASFGGTSLNFTYKMPEAWPGIWLKISILFFVEQQTNGWNSADCHGELLIGADHSVLHPLDTVTEMPAYFLFFHLTFNPANAIGYMGWLQWHHIRLQHLWSPPSFGIGDVLGCGMNLETRQIIFTLSGKRLSESNID
ncbi:hypothetical protein niasHS_008277 [Heterodera schachtii]|uniref:B30.2/SPRY domain-containing protein n=1 Tax=Heterodera schachtii TaxID=97005 RepID=A0ABD2IVG5_HETSC